MSLNSSMIIEHVVAKPMISLYLSHLKRWDGASRSHSSSSSSSLCWAEVAINAACQRTWIYFINSPLKLCLCEMLLAFYWGAQYILTPFLSVCKQNKHECACKNSASNVATQKKVLLSFEPLPAVEDGKASIFVVAFKCLQLMELMMHRGLCSYGHLLCTETTRFWIQHWDASCIPKACSSSAVVQIGMASLIQKFS